MISIGLCLWLFRVVCIRLCRFFSDCVCCFVKFFSSLMVWFWILRWLCFCLFFLIMCVVIFMLVRLSLFWFSSSVSGLNRGCVSIFLNIWWWVFFLLVYLSIIFLLVLFLYQVGCWILILFVMICWIICCSMVNIVVCRFLYILVRSLGLCCLKVVWCSMKFWDCLRYVGWDW